MQAQQKFQLYSTAFEDGGKIPAQYTCDGADVSPALQWLFMPEGTKSLVLIVTSYDAVKVMGFPVKHWVVYDIPPLL